MRAEASIKNSVYATGMMIIKILTGFISRKIFVLILGAEYLGANGLFSNIITLLNLAELGIGQAIIFNLYRPIAKDDKETIKSLLQLYKKAYNIIAVVVFVLGIFIIPFLNFFIGETTLDLNFTIVYILFLLQSVSSYLMTYKRSILYAYQENYIISLIDILYIIALNVVQLSVLYFTKNYYLYLLINIICILLENMIINFVTNKRYNFIKDKNIQTLDKKIEVDIFNRIKAEFLHKIGGIVVNGTDNILISKFLGLTTVGLYSNYYMIIYYVGGVFKQMISAVMPSVGNLLVEENKENINKVYRKISFFNFWTTTFSGVSIFVIIQSFIKLWLGEAYLLPITVVITLVINYYLRTMRASNDVFLSGAGISIETRFVPVIESILNIVFSIVLLRIFGLAGVFMGTIISTMALWGYTYPKFCYKRILGKGYKDYIRENLACFLLFTFILVITYGISTIFAFDNLLLDVVARVILCICVPNLILFLIFRKSEEFEYFINLTKVLIFRTKRTN